jgi:hypothetical protein
MHTVLLGSILLVAPFLNLDSEISNSYNFEWAVSNSTLGESITKIQERFKIKVEFSD